jgi:rhodanese-related sulfurtransferase
MMPGSNPTTGRVATDMAIIVLVAAAIGIAWNHRLLYNVWTGMVPAAGQSAPGATPQPDIPLPLGLIQARELDERKEALFVDARDAGAFAAGHIRGAVSLPVGDADARLPVFAASIPTVTTLVIYCNGYDCRDSRDLGAKLLKAGYRKVYVFEGGWPEWRDAGFPTDRGTS